MKNEWALHDDNDKKNNNHINNDNTNNNNINGFLTL